MTFLADLGLPADLTFYIVGLITTFIMAVGKGAFGGGLAIVGIPLLALVIDPFRAAIITAFLVALMDAVAIGTFSRSSWSKPDLVYLLPGMLLGIIVGFLVFEYIDRRYVILLISSITLAFTARHFLMRGQSLPPMPLNPALGVLSGAATGFTTYVAHSGGPPLAMYLLRRGLDKKVYAGTSVVVFTLGNLCKTPGYVYAGLGAPETFWMAAILAPAVPLGVWIGKIVNDRLPREHLFNLCYGLVAIAGLKLFYDALRAFL